MSYKHEHVAWDHISVEATICDFAFSDLQALAESNAQFCQLLRLGELSSTGSTGKIHRALGLQPAILEGGLASAIGQFTTCLFTLRPISAQPIDFQKRGKHVQALVTGLIEGWHLRPTARLTPAEWISLADNFVQPLEKAVGTVHGIDRIRLCAAFLRGVQEGFNPWDSKSLVTMRRRCETFGITDVDAILNAYLAPPVNRFERFIYTASTSSRAIEQGANMSTTSSSLSTSTTQHTMCGTIDSASSTSTDSSTTAGCDEQSSPTTKSPRPSNNVRVVIAPRPVVEPSASKFVVISPPRPLQVPRQIEKDNNVSRTLTKKSRRIGILGTPITTPPAETPGQSFADTFLGASRPCLGTPDRTSSAQSRTTPLSTPRLDTTATSPSPPMISGGTRDSTHIGRSLLTPEQSDTNDEDDEIVVISSRIRKRVSENDDDDETSWTPSKKRPRSSCAFQSDLQ